MSLFDSTLQNENSAHGRFYSQAHGLKEHLERHIGSYQEDLHIIADDLYLNSKIRPVDLLCVSQDKNIKLLCLFENFSEKELIELIRIYHWLRYNLSFFKKYNIQVENSDHIQLHCLCKESSHDVQDFVINHKNYPIQINYYENVLYEGNSNWLFISQEQLQDEEESDDLADNFGTLPNPHTYRDNTTKQDEFEEIFGFDTCLDDEVTHITEAQEIH